MPAYEYQCNACGGRFQERQKMSDPEVESCPGCGGTVKRLISGGAGNIFNGDFQGMGVYRSDVVFLATPSDDPIGGTNCTQPQ
jgi:putative FmdB family regulatory protein